MRYSDKFSNKLNDLLNMNYKVEKIYLEAFKNATDDTLKAFFKERQIKRSEFSMELRKEIDSHNIAPRSVNVLSKYYHKNQMNDSNNDSLNDNENILFEIFNLLQTSIDSYNELLREINLPLSLCKILIRQRDNIQDTMRVFQREDVFLS
ncbi:DUF2383 domain-containing protein [Yeosuana sp. MJ-SS3]|uniref:DUF2383 domain-containing protein n=1 Tax=Gilvirhabdus luticola TaxID=3079858 RepID=A0ABU3U3L8_9FLAO|nr:DUF2383 domain-containing protein [Yeosuana sp. MJ-SS3]MDU8884995.1 DUF2383 domain-containing protein [Yeosuana sp. MJ-SS3]